MMPQADPRLCEDRHDPAVDWGAVLGLMPLAPPPCAHDWHPWPDGLALWACRACGWAVAACPVN